MPLPRPLIHALSVCASLLAALASLLLSPSLCLADPSPAARAQLDKAATLEAHLASAPDDAQAHLAAAAALNAAMAIETNGNLPLVDGLQDTDEHRALWAELAPRALEHARKAAAARPDSADAAAAVSTAYMFYASSLGIVASIIQGAGGEYREHARRLIELDPDYDDGLGYSLMGSFYLVAPWPIGDSDEARAELEKALAESSGSVRNHYLLGVYWAREGDWTKAADHLAQAASKPCVEGTEQLFCEWMQAEATRQLERVTTR